MYSYDTNRFLCSLIPFTLALTVVVGCAEDDNESDSPGVAYTGKLYSDETGVVCNGHLIAGAADISDQLLCREAYAIAYNYNSKMADWASTESPQSPSLHRFFTMKI